MSRQTSVFRFALRHTSATLKLRCPEGVLGDDLLFKRFLAKISAIVNLVGLCRRLGFSTSSVENYSHYPLMVRGKAGISKGTRLSGTWLSPTREAPLADHALLLKRATLGISG